MLRWRLSVLLLLVLAKPAAAHAPPPARPHPPPPPFSLLGSFETAFAGEAVSLLSPSQLACVEVVALQARAAASAAPHTRGGAHRLQLSHATCADCGAVGYCPTASGKKGASLVTVSLWSECTHLGGASKTLHFPASALAAAAAANVTLPGGTSSASPNATLPGLRVGFCATAPSTIAVLVITAAAAVLGLLCVAAGVAVCLRRRRRREAAADGDAAQPLSPAPRQRVHPLVAAVAEPHRGVRVRAGPTRRAPAAAAAPSPPSTAASPPQPQPHQRCCCGLLPAAPKLGAFLGLLAAQQATVLLLTSLLFDTAAVLFLSQKVASASLHLVAAALFIVSGGLDGLELRAAGARAARLDAEFGTRLARLQRLRWAAFAGNTTGGVLVVAGSVYALQAAEDYGDYTVLGNVLFSAGIWAAVVALLASAAATRQLLLDVALATTGAPRAAMDETFWVLLFYALVLCLFGGALSATLYTTQSLAGLEAGTALFIVSNIIFTALNVLGLFFLWREHCKGGDGDGGAGGDEERPAVGAQSPAETAGGGGGAGGAGAGVGDPSADVVGGDDPERGGAAGCGGADGCGAGGAGGAADGHPAAATPRPAPPTAGARYVLELAGLLQPPPSSAAAAPPSRRDSLAAEAVVVHAAGHTVGTAGTAEVDGAGADAGLGGGGDGGASGGLAGATSAGDQS